MAISHISLFNNLQCKLSTTNSDEMELRCGGGDIMEFYTQNLDFCRNPMVAWKFGLEDALSFMLLLSYSRNT